MQDGNTANFSFLRHTLRPDGTDFVDDRLQVPGSKLQKNLEPETWNLQPGQSAIVLPILSKSNLEFQAAHGLILAKVLASLISA
jgi:hypothetical protein